MAEVYTVVMIMVDCTSTTDGKHNPKVKSILTQPFELRRDAETFVRLQHDALSWAEQRKLITYITPSTEIL